MRMIRKIGLGIGPVSSTHMTLPTKSNVYVTVVPLSFISD